MIPLSKNNQLILKAYEAGYRVDRAGNVISPHSGENLRLNLRKDYYQFGIGHAGKVKVHRLQAYQKYGPKIFAEGIQVRHLNGNAKDNSYQNIAIGTASDNMMDKPKWLRVKQASQAHKKHKNVLEIRNFYRLNKSYKKTMERFNISSKGTLHFILNNAIHENEDYTQSEIAL